MRELSCFSAAAFLSPPAALRAAVRKDSLHLFALGDWGEEGSKTQPQVANAMQAYATTNQIPIAALLFLGDNWYGWLWGGIHSPRWQKQYEQMYPASAFPGPCYAVLGNHDYERRPHNKAEAELAYSKSCSTRWSMPAKWYSASLPADRPLLKIIALDSNYPHAPSLFETPSLTEEEIRSQRSWLKAELGTAASVPFTLVMAHHPIYSNGDHGDTRVLIQDWRPLFERRLVHVYLSGHDHDLQHLEFSGDRTSYVISGGGGAVLRNLRSTRGSEYGEKISGFTHIEVNPLELRVRHVDSFGRVLHTFGKLPNGDLLSP